MFWSLKIEIKKNVSLELLAVLYLIGSFNNKYWKVFTRIIQITTHVNAFV